MRNNITKPLLVYCLCSVLALLLLSFYLWQQNQPVALVEPTGLKDNKLQCVSYAPHYKKGDSPFVKGMWIQPEKIEQDLKLLATMSHCVRTYSVGQGMDYVPEVAAKVGMQVYLGAWIGWTDADNVKELQLAAKVANAYPDTIKGLIVGNEVLLRGEQDEAAMKRYFALAKSLTNVPITYADVWEFWIKHQKMAQHIDFQTVHILPYWENEPAAIDDAVQHAEKVMANMNALFSKPILIGETGWPSVGRQRSQSVPSLINQARYIREFVQKAQEQQWQYNIIEAIDQPWKRVLEGTVGGNWGLFTYDLQAKFSLKGAVAERQDGQRLFLAALVGALLFCAAAKTLKEQRRLAWLGLGAIGALTGIMLLLKLDYIVAASRDWIEWLALGGLALLGTLMLMMQPWIVAGHCPRAQQLTALIRIIFVYAALIAGYLIYFDGRYRDFPVLLFALPVLVMVVGPAKQLNVSVSNYFICFMPAVLSVMFAALCLAKEPVNHAAQLWLMISIGLAIASWPRRNLSASL